MRRLAACLPAAAAARRACPLCITIDAFPCISTRAAGIPNFVDVRSSLDGSVDTTRISNNSTTSGSAVDSSRFWFAVLQQIDLDPSLLPDSDLGSSEAGSTGTPAPAPLHAYGQTKPAAFADIELLQLLGAGFFGRVYRAKWQGSMVAVKVGDGAPAAGPISAKGSTTLSRARDSLTRRHALPCRSSTARPRARRRRRCWRRPSPAT